MSNKKFYIQFENQVYVLETHQTIQGDLRPVPVATILNLLLDLFSDLDLPRNRLNTISIYASSDPPEEIYFATDLNTLSHGLDFNKPLVVRPKSDFLPEFLINCRDTPVVQSVDPNKWLDGIPPDYRLMPGHPRLTVSNSTDKGNFTVTKWLYFTEEVRLWKQSQTLNKTIQVQMPGSLPVQFEHHLQALVYANYLEAVKPFDESVTYIVHIKGQDDKHATEPDAIMQRNNTTQIVFKVTGPWVLDLQDIFISETELSPVAFRPLNQLYGYMKSYKVKYGVLSTYQVSWFLKRTIRKGKKDILEISVPIQRKHTKPTARACYAYFQSLEDGRVPISRTPSPPSFADNAISPNTSNSNASSRSPCHIETRSGTKRNMTASASTQKLMQDSMNTTLSGGMVGISQEEMSTSSEWTAFQITNADGESCDELWIQSGTWIGKGRSDVYPARYKGEYLALKIGDAKELENELIIYEELKDIQGVRIPRVLFSANLPEDSGFGQNQMGIVMTQCGSPPDSLTRPQFKFLRETLDILHSRVITHNDIKLSNFLVDQDGRAYLIDFGNSYISEDGEVSNVDDCLMNWISTHDVRD